MRTFEDIHQSTIGNSSFPYITVIYIAVGLYAVAALYLVYALFFGSSRPFPGQLTIQIIGTWDSPSGERVRGVVKIIPSEKEIMSVFGPTISDISPLAFSPNADLAIGARSTASSTQLLELSTKTQSITSVIDTEAAGGGMYHVVRSPNALMYAYVFVPPIQKLSTTTTVAGKTVELRPDDSPESRINPEVQLPEQYQPQLRVSAQSSEVRTLTRNSIPLAFSEDSSALLVAVLGKGLEIISLDGSEPPISVGGVREQQRYGIDVHVRSSWNGKYVAIYDAREHSVYLYAIDWSSATLKLVHTAPADSVAVPNNDGALLYADQLTGVLTLHAPNKSGAYRVSKYKAVLPAAFRLFDWNL